MLSVDEIEKQAEDLYATVMDQLYKQYAGLPFDEPLLFQTAIKGKELDQNLQKLFFPKQKTLRLKKCSH